MTLNSVAQNRLMDLICDEFSEEYEESMSQKEKQSVFVRQVQISLNFMSNSQTVKDSLLKVMEDNCPELLAYQTDKREKNPLLLINSEAYWRSLYGLENDDLWKKSKILKTNTYCVNRLKKKEDDPQELCSCTITRLSTFLTYDEFMKKLEDEQRRILDRIMDDFCKPKD